MVMGLHGYGEPQLWGAKVMGSYSLWGSMIMYGEPQLWGATVMGSHSYEDPGTEECFPSQS